MIVDNEIAYLASASGLKPTGVVYIAASYAEAYDVDRSIIFTGNTIDAFADIYSIITVGFDEYNSNGNFLSFYSFFEMSTWKWALCFI